MVERLLGVAATPGGCHPDWGTKNALIALGEETYLEIVGPDPARRAVGVPTLFGIDRLDGPTLVTWAAKACDLDSAVIAARADGLDLGDVTAGCRTTPDGGNLAWRLTDPFAGRAEGVVPFLIDWGTTPSPARTATPGCRLVDLRAEHPDAERVRKWVSALGLSLRVEHGQRPALVASIATTRGVVELA